MTRFGLLTPVLSRVTGEHAEWERDGTIDDVRQIAEAADRLGYDYLTCSEHVAIPAMGMDLPGPCYWDPLATFGYLAAFTTRIRLATSVLVLAYHHPLEIAKRFAAQGFGHYHERYVRCPDGKWRISSVRLTRLRSNSVPHQEPDLEVTLDPDTLEAVAGGTTGGRTA